MAQRIQASQRTEVETMTSPPFSWPGGKSKLKKRIIVEIPPHKTYVEPFVGGGSVLFAKPLAEKNVINDLDKNLINFYKDLKNNGCKTAKSCKLPTTKKQFDELDEKNPCGLMGQIKTSYGGKRKTFHPGTYERPHTTKNPKRQCNDQQTKLKKTSILNNDFEIVLEKYNKKDTFAYLDPPYVGSENFFKSGGDDASPEKVCKCLKKFKGKFLLSYNDNPRVKKACKDFEIKKIDTKYEMQRKQTGTMKPVKELLIRNY